MEDQPKIEPIEPEPPKDEGAEQNQAESGLPAEIKPASRRRSTEEALREVRQSLRDDEIQARQEKRPSFFARLTARWRRSAAAKKQGPEPGVIEIPSPEEQPNPLERPAAVPAKASEPSLVTEPAPEAIQAPEAPTTPTEPVAGEAEKIQTEASEGVEFRKILFTEEQQEPEAAGPHRSILTRLHADEGQEGKETSEMRRAVLEGYVTEPEEQAAQPQLPLRQRMRRTWRDMRPLEKRTILGVLVVLGVMVVLGVGALALPAVLPKAPPPTPTDSNLPYPISIGLPGGWVFPLSRGSVVDGRWDPARPEWLTGTEISRWVALPWSVQLEAVLRTLKLDDPIMLFMSNNTNLVYKVKRVEQVPTDQISHLESRQPSLILVLSNQATSSRWVVSAAP